MTFTCNKSWPFYGSPPERTANKMSDSRHINTNPVRAPRVGERVEMDEWKMALPAIVNRPHASPCFDGIESAGRNHGNLALKRPMSMNASPFAEAKATVKGYSHEKNKSFRKTPPWGL